MKKAAIIGIATFYLLLTTGMFVCIVHCAAETLSAKPAMQMMQAKMKGCNKNGDCKCCKQHGSYAVKENIKPGNDTQAVHLFSLISQPWDAAKYSTYVYAVTQTSWTDSNAPPYNTGKLISIRFHSLQI